MDDPPAGAVAEPEPRLTLLDFFADPRKWRPYAIVAGVFAVIGLIGNLIDLPHKAVCNVPWSVGVADQAAFIAAVETNDKGALFWLKLRCADPAMVIQVNTGETVAMRAATRGWVDSLDSLLSTFWPFPDGAPLGQRDKAGNNLLHYAAMGGDWPAIESIATRYPALRDLANAADQRPSELVAACGAQTYGNFLKLAAWQRPPPGPFDAIAQAPNDLLEKRLRADLEAAAAHDDVAALMAELEFGKTIGIDANGTGAGGNTLLMLAAGAGSLKVVDALIQKFGVDIGAGNAAGQTALMIAAAKPQVDAVAALLAAGASLRDPGLSRAWLGETPDAARAPLEAAASELDTRLRQAVDDNAPDQFATLIAAGASAFAADGDKESALSRAIANETEDTALALFESLYELAPPPDEVLSSNRLFQQALWNRETGSRQGADHGHMDNRVLDRLFQLHFRPQSLDLIVLALMPVFGNDKWDRRLFDAFLDSGARFENQTDEPPLARIFPRLVAGNGAPTAPADVTALLDRLTQLGLDPGRGLARAYARLLQAMAAPAEHDVGSRGATLFDWLAAKAGTPAAGSGLLADALDVDENRFFEALARGLKSGREGDADVYLRLYNKAAAAPADMARWTTDLALAREVGIPPPPGLATGVLGTFLDPHQTVSADFALTLAGAGAIDWTTIPTADEEAIGFLDGDMICPGAVANASTVADRLLRFRADVMEGDTRPVDIESEAEVADWHTHDAEVDKLLSALLAGGARISSGTLFLCTYGLSWGPAIMNAKLPGGLSAELAVAALGAIQGAKPNAEDLAAALGWLGGSERLTTPIRSSDIPSSAPPAADAVLAIIASMDFGANDNDGTNSAINQALIRTARVLLTPDERQRIADALLARVPAVGLVTLEWTWRAVGLGRPGLGRMIEALDKKLTAPPPDIDLEQFARDYCVDPEVVAVMTTDYSRDLSAYCANA